MKYCVSSRVGAAVLKKADEIKFQFRDRKAIPDFYDKYPNADIILYCSYVDEIDWDEIKTLNVLGQGKFILGLASVQDMFKAKELGYRFFYGFPVTSMFELNAIKNLNVEYVKIGIPLFFNMDDAKSAGIPIRVVPNVAYDDGLPHGTGIHGKWIRPEDLETLYGDYVAAAEFEGVTPDKEELLFRVYAEDHAWRRGLDLIIVNLNFKGNNRLLVQEETENRLNCGQRCERNKCHICDRSFSLADPELIREYKEKKAEQSEEPTE